MLNTLQQQDRDSVPPLQSEHTDAADPEAGALVRASLAQQRLWLIEQLLPHSPIYNVANLIELQGLLDLAALRKSLALIIQRHDALRTRFSVIDGQPFQIVMPSLELPLGVVDLQLLPIDERSAVAVEQARLVARRPFDLRCGPLIRVLLLRRAATDHTLLLVTHHIIFDGWSMNLFVQELAELYTMIVAGQPASLPELTLQYSDFSVQQRRRLQGEVMQGQLDHWQRRLQGITLADLPTDQPRPAAPTFRGRRITATISPALTAQLAACGQRIGATLFMTLLAGFAMLLHAYSKQDDLVIGSPIAGRTRAEVSGLIGFFVNTLILRIDLSGNPPFEEVLERVRTVCLDAYDHQDVPFDQVISMMQPERDRGRTPLLQTLFVLQSALAAPPQVPHLTLSYDELDIGVARFDQSWILREIDAGLNLTVEYATDLFVTETIEQMVRQYQLLLEQVAERPERRMHSLSVLTPSERTQLLVTWNATRAAYAHDCCIHDLFEHWAGRSPDSIALVFDDQQLSYGRLNQQANQIAEYLRTIGVGAEVPVGISMDRSLELIAALLGIFKAGGAYVPLDPSYPQERLAFMLQDSHLAILLTQQHLVPKFAGSPTKVVCLDGSLESLASQPATVLAGRAGPANSAYMIYTSGSTGQPKGMLIEHRSVNNLVVTQQQATDVGPGSRVFQFSSLSFDASLFEIVMALCTGATLGMASRAESLPGPGLARLLNQLAVTILNMAPSALAAMPAHQLPALKTIIVGGEACSSDLVARWGAAHRLINGYGPTETTAWTTYDVCAEPDQKPTIGRPVANSQVYVLDRLLRLVPIGAPGEIYIGGAGVGRGYLGRPDLTAERFIPDPFGDQPGRRLYRSGDLARYLPDGRLDFLGRIDHQIKLRGYRIELGEIAAALEQHPAVREALVLVRGVGGENRQIIGYVLVDQAQPPDLADLQQFLEQRLPGYMVPTAFALVDTWPLNASGKIDRQALPEPELVRSAAFVAPTTVIEHSLSAIWEQVIGRSPIGINDNFFSLGGHSLLGAQIIARVQQQMAIELPLQTLFDHPTIAALAAHIAALLHSAPAGRAPELKPVNRSRYHANSVQ